MQKHGIVILQDKEQKCEELKRAFEASGEFEVLFTSTDGEEGVGQILKLDAEYCITDLILSGLDGLGVLDRLAKGGSNTKVIVYSAISREEVVETCISKGAAFYITKPCDAITLVKRIKDLFLSEKRGAPRTVFTHLVLFPASRQRKARKKAGVPHGRPTPGQM